MLRKSNVPSVSADYRDVIGRADAEGRFLSVDLEVVEVGPTWKHYEMTVTVPEQAGYAFIYASSHERGSAWFDDFSFTEVSYDNEY